MGDEAVTDRPTEQASKAYGRLQAILGEVYDLSKSAAILSWDELVHMPKGGAENRASMKATVERLVHARFTSDEVGELLEELAPFEDASPYESDEASLIRVTRRNYYQYKKVPPDLVVAMSKAGSRGYHAWVEARSANDFEVYRPYLKTVTGLLVELTEAMGYGERRYDALLDRRESGVPTVEMERLFDQIRADLVPLVQAVRERVDAVDDSVLHQPFDVDKQRAVAREGARLIGFDFERGRLDESVHPISFSVSPADVRLTTRINPNFFGACFFSCIHEAGHGIYFQGVPWRFRGTTLDGTPPQGANLTPVYGGTSTGLHESQSRFWENVVCRSRAFWEHFLPRLREYFPGQLDDVSVDTWYRAINRSSPGLVRVEADQLTYDLHIMLRFELENGLLEGTLDVDDLRQAWDDLSEQYLGQRPKDALQGVLQDIHWSRGGHGGFPSYTIGNVTSIQLLEAMQRDLPEFDDLVRAGTMEPIRAWMQRQLYDHGSKFQPLELMERITGSPRFDAAPYLRYLREKFGALYGVA